MSASTKLSTSVKALCYLAESYPTPRSSKEISENTGLNASKLRQLLSLLSKQNIVVSTQGKSGGFLLGKEPSEINLQEIYCAIEDRKAFHLDVSNKDDNSNQPVLFNNYFLGLFADVQVDIENKMRNISLLSILSDIGITLENFSQ